MIQFSDMGRLVADFLIKSRLILPHLQLGKSSSAILNTKRIKFPYNTKNIANDKTPIVSNISLKLLMTRLILPKKPEIVKGIIISISVFDSFSRYLALKSSYPSSLTKFIVRKTTGNSNPITCNNAVAILVRVVGVVIVWNVCNDSVTSHTIKLRHSS